MNVSLENLLGAANRINNRQTGNKVNNNANETEKTDKIELGSRVNTRLDSIQNDLKDIQVSLTKNQIIRNGLNQINENLKSGNSNPEKVYEEFRFNNQKVVMDYLEGKKDVNQQYLNEKIKSNENDIKMDIAGLKKLQIESENIFASNLANQGKVTDLMKEIGGSSIKANTFNNFNSDIVMKLTK